MSEHPVLFSGPMVRAILEGRKTQTRRVVRPQPPKGYDFHEYVFDPTLSARFENHPPRGSGMELGMWTKRCPYGQPGDRLWVRETWMPDGADIRFGMMKRGEIAPAVRFRASEPELGKVWKWKPSIFMPRWASRLTLEVVSVRVQRVQEIGEEDARAEGFQPRYVPADPICEKLGSPLTKGSTLPAVASFYVLWDQLNAKRGFGWDANPWVWVIEFRRLNPDAKEAA